MSVRVVSIVGARPQFINLAPVCRAIDAYNRTAEVPFEHLIVHTGQHYDADLSEIFFEELEIPRPDINLGVGSGPHGQQTGRMQELFERYLLERKPDAVLVYGDTNSTIAGALVAVKQQIPVAHVEAGLRSFNRLMPEEVNRVATDHVCDLLFAPTQTAMNLLAREGLGRRAVLSGDVGLDAVRFNQELARRKSKILETLRLAAGQYTLMTVQRSENTEGGRLIELFSWLADARGTGGTIIMPIHPRTANHLPRDAQKFNEFPGIRLTKPLGYLDMLQLLGHARMVLTDSGGLQKEAYFLSTPCITLREETEWIETVEASANLLAGFDQRRILEAIEHWGSQDDEAHRAARKRSISYAFGNGDAAHRIIKELATYLSARTRLDPG